MSPSAASISPTSTDQKPKLLDQVWQAARAKGHSEATASAFVNGSREFILFHHRKHPRDMGPSEIAQYLDHVARSAAAPLQALATQRTALDFLYREVLHVQVGELPWPPPPRLLDQVRQVLRVKHYSPRTEDCYTQWTKRFILFHGKKHPREMGAAEVEAFLTDLAVNGHVSASTQNQALNALVFRMPRCWRSTWGGSTPCGRGVGSGCRWCWRRRKSPWC